MNNCVKINSEKIKFIDKVLGLGFTGIDFSDQYVASGKIKNLTKILELETKVKPYGLRWEYELHFKDEESMTMFTMQYL